MSNYRDREELNYMRNLKCYPVIRDPKEVAKLLKRWRKNGDRRAYNQLIYSNTRLVLSTARKYANRGMEFFDLVQEGFLGLMRALEDFDPKQSRISTYGTLWIRQNISRALADKSRTMRIPVPRISQMSHVQRAINEFYHEHRRQPSYQEIHDQIRGWKGTKKTVVSQTITLEEVESCRLLLYRKENSLDAPPINQNNWSDNLSFGDAVADSRENVEAKVELRRLQKAVLECIKYRLQKERIPQRTLSIVRFRFEFGQSLEYTGKHFELTRERIRQIEAVFIAKIAKDLKLTKEGVRHILVGLPLKECGG